MHKIKVLWNKTNKGFKNSYAILDEPVEEGAVFFERGEIWFTEIFKLPMLSWEDLDTKDEEKMTDWTRYRLTSFSF